jgi:hypothetical protein
MLRRAVDWCWANVLGILIAAYFVLKFAVLLVLWTVLGPVAFVFMVFGSEAVFDLLNTLIDGMDSIAWRIYNFLDFTRNESDPPKRVA